MRSHSIPSYYRKVEEILIMPSDLALLSTLIGSNYSCLELIFMVPKVFEPLKFDCKQLFLQVCYTRKHLPIDLLKEETLEVYQNLA